MSWIYLINDLNEEEFVGTFYRKKLQKANQKVFRVAKVIKRKGGKLYFKMKVCDNSFKSWIDKKTKYNWANNLQNQNL